MPPTQTQNRKDLLQAYRLMTTRSALALIAGEPDSPNQPLRRRSTATVSGILVGVIVCVLFGVLGAVGVLGTPEKNLAQNGVLVIDKDTGTSYVPCDKGDLCPALNYTSALLALKDGSPKKTSVSQAQLAGTTIGPTIGIMGLPQDLPTASNLVKGPWAVCDNASGTTSTLVGGKSVGGTPLAGTTAGLVRSGGQDYVLLDGQKMPIQPRFVPLTFRGAQPQPVTAAWINAVPAGPKFAPPALQGLGQNSPNPALAGKVGQVFNTSTGPTVLAQDGSLHPVTSLQALLLEEQSGTAAKQAPPTSSIGSREPNPSPMPENVPQTSAMTGTICYTYAAGGKQSITTGATVPANATSTGNSTSATVNKVWLPSGGGALIGMTAAPGSTTASSWVLLSGATRYGLNGSGVASYLGYNLSKDETFLPASLVTVLPEGKGLDPVAAAQPASG